MFHEPANFEGMLPVFTLRPSTPSQASTKMETSDDALQDHYLRVQKTLLGAVDKQVKEIETQLIEKERVLKRTEDDKRDLGVSLYKANIAIDKLNETVYEGNLKLMESESTKKIAFADRIGTDRQLAELHESKNYIADDLLKSRKALEDALLQIGQLKEINLAYHSDIKVQKRICGKLQKELEISEMKRKQLETSFSEEKKMNEELLKDKGTLELANVAQKQETMVAQSAVDKMHREINQLTSSKKKFEKQWEEAVSAMAKRDQAFQAIQDSKDKEHELLLSKNNEFRAQKYTLEESEHFRRQKELECVSLQNQNNHLKEQNLLLETKLREQKRSSVEAQVAESLYKQELTQTSKLHGLAKDELDRKSATVSELKANIEKLREEFDLTIQNELIKSTARKEEQVEAKATLEIQKVKLNLEGKNYIIRRDNATLKLALHEKADIINEVMHQKEKIQEKYQQINHAYIQLYEEAKHLVYGLERKELDVNLLKSKLQEQIDSDPTQPYQILLLKLQKELQGAKIDNDKLQKMWLESQKINFEQKQENEKLKNETLFLATQLGVTDTIGKKVATEMDEHKKERIESKLENSKLYTELRRIQPIIDELNEKNVTLERQLYETKLQLEEIKLIGDSSNKMLQTEIRRLYGDRKDVQKARIHDEKAANVIERKQMLSTEMMEKLKEERKMLRKENFELKVKAGEMEKLYKNASLQAQKLADLAGKNVGELANRLSSTSLLGSGKRSPAPLPPWGSLGSTPKGGNSMYFIPPPPSINEGHTPIEGAPGDVKEDVPDFESWRLKIDSLSYEREYLINENKQIKREVEELNVKLAMVDRNNQENQIKIKNLDRDLKAQINAVKVMQSKLTKASKVAASIEKQFKDTKPNAKIDYSLMIESEPSTQLLAALLAIPKEMSSQEFPTRI